VNKAERDSRVRKEGERGGREGEVRGREGGKERKKERKSEVLRTTCKLY
jgi:hypothetical protein